MLTIAGAEIEEFAVFVALTLAAVGILVDLACFRWSSAAKSLFYIELLYYSVTNLIPSNEGVGQANGALVFCLVSSICFFCNPLSNLISLTLVTTWLTLGQFPLVFDFEVDAEYALESIELVFVVAVGFFGVLVAVGQVAAQNKNMALQETDNFNLLNSMQEGLFVMSRDLSQIKFGSKTALRIMDYRQDVLAGCDMQKDIDPSLLTMANFKPMKFSMDSLLMRQDDDTNLISTKDSEQSTYVSLEDIVTYYSDEVKVYMIKPGGVLPACQPKAIKNQFCSIHVKKIMYEGEMCIAVYFCCMTHHVDAMRLQSVCIDEKNKADTMQSSVSVVSHEFRTPLSTSIMFLENCITLCNDPK